jgi:hypothetical protein
MTYADPEQRAALINGFRALAEYLESNPDAPAPSYATVYVFPPDSTCAVKRTEIDAIADLLGVEAGETAGGSHYSATRYFGPVEYDAIAICKQPCHATAGETGEAAQ